MKKIVRHAMVYCGLFASLAVQAQFPPQVGFEGTTAIHKDSSVFVNWATGCIINRGWMDIADTSAGKTQVGDETYVPGKAGNGVVSLGDGGSAVVTFEKPVTNGPGYDFAIFENGFIDQTLAPGLAFLELAFVEVSSDGIHYVRFDATSLNDTLKQLASFEAMDAAKINNLAGKYTVNYGTPFDLEELKDAPGLDVENITHIRLIDVVGSINPLLGSRDASGAVINDPYPTAFASGGFDLDAVGVIHESNSGSTGLMAFTRQNVTAYPNPVHSNEGVQIQTAGKPVELQCYNSNGQLVNIRTEQTTDFSYRIHFDAPGMYLIRCIAANGEGTVRVLVQ